MEPDADFPYHDFDEEEEVRTPIPTRTERLYGGPSEEFDDEDDEMRLAMQVSRVAADADAEEEALRVAFEASIASVEEDEKRRAKAEVEAVRERVLALIQRAYPVIVFKLAYLPDLKEEREITLKLLQQYRESREVSHLSVSEEEFNKLYVVMIEVQKRRIFSEEEHNELLAHFMP